MKRKTVVVHLLTLFPIPLLAQPFIAVSSVQEAFRYALEGNPDLGIYNQRQAQAKQEWSNQKNAVLPVVSGSFGEDAQ